MDVYYKKYVETFGDFEINLIVPNYDNSVYGYNESHIKYADKVIEKYDGKVYFCEATFDKEGSDFWTVDNWEKMSASSSEILQRECGKYEKVIVITVDPPFLHTPRYYFRKCENINIQFVLLMYTSAYIHDEELSPERVRWEYEGLHFAEANSQTKIGNVCNFMTDHFIKKYEVKKEYFVSYSSSLFLQDKDFSPISSEEIQEVLKEYNIPLDRDIFFLSEEWLG